MNKYVISFNGRSNFFSLLKGAFIVLFKGRVTIGFDVPYDLCEECDKIKPG